MGILVTKLIKSKYVFTKNNNIAKYRCQIKFNNIYNHIYLINYNNYTSINDIFEYNLSKDMQLILFKLRSYYYRYIYNNDHIIIQYIADDISILNTPLKLCFTYKSEGWLRNDNEYEPLDIFVDINV